MSYFYRMELSSIMYTVFNTVFVMCVPFIIYKHINIWHISAFDCNVMVVGEILCSQLK